MKNESMSTLAAKKLRASSEVIAELAELERSKSQAQTRLTDLDAKYDAAILAGDAAAEKHEAETAVTKRGIRRAELRKQELESELKAAQELEAQDDRRRRQSEARAAVAAVLAEVEKSYRTPAKAVAAFLARYEAAEQLAAAARVDGPHKLLRMLPDTVVPAHDQEYDVYVDEYGVEVSNQYPAGSYHIDAKTGGRIYEGSGGSIAQPYPTKTKTRKVSEQIILGRRELDLVESIKLPGLRVGEPPIWPTSTE